MGKDSDKAVRIVALLITPIITGYITLVTLGYIHSDSYVSPLVAWGVTIIWLLLGLYTYFSKASDQKASAMRLVVYHFLSLSTLSFVIGFSSPFTSMLALLILATYTYFGWNGLIYSTIYIVVAAVFDATHRILIQPDIFLMNISGVVAALTLGSALVAIISTQEIRRKALLRSQIREQVQYRRMMTIINNLTDATFSTDSKGNVMIYNAACLNLLDTNQSLRGKNISELFKLTDENKKRHKLFDIIQQSDRASSRDDLTHTYSDGESIRIEVTYAPIKSAFRGKSFSPTNAGYVVIVRDITKRKSLEEERDEFISVVSHELRTPITIVEGTISNLNLILERGNKADQRLVKNGIETAHDQILYLAKMVNDLSTLSRAERGVGDEPEHIDVRTLLEDMFQRYQKEASQKKLELKLNLDTRLGSVYASRLYTEELLQNFITNAIKYTKAGSITITGEQAGKTVKFAVSDTGIGISRSDQAKIFDKFYRSEDYRIRETSGTGLGLYVSLKLAHKLKTHINLESRLDHGSTFSFELPLAQDDPSR